MTNSARRSVYVLIVPTYGGGNIKGAVPKQVIKFLNDRHNRGLCAGDLFWEHQLRHDLLGRNIISALHPQYKFEAPLSAKDVSRVREELSEFLARKPH